MKYLTIGLFLLFNITQILQAQKPVVELDTPVTVKLRELLKHLKSDETGRYLLFRENGKPKFGFASSKDGVTESDMGTKYFLERYDPKGKLVFSKEIKEGFIGFYAMNDKIFYISSGDDSEDDKISYTLNFMDENGEKTTTKDISLSKISDDPRLVNHSMIKSPNDSRLLWVARSGSYSKKNNFETYLFVFNSDFEIEWSKAFQIPVPEKKFKASDFKVTDKGEVFFLGRTFEKNRKAGYISSEVDDLEKIDNQLDLFHVTKDAKTSYKTPINSKKELKGGQLAVNKEDQLTFVSLYGDSRKGPSQGIFSQTWNHSENKWEEGFINAFTEKELTSFGKKITQKDSKSKSLGLKKDYMLGSVFFKTNGELIAVAEENITKVTTGGTTGNGTEYLSNHLIVFQFSDPTTVKRATIIPKMQRSGFSDYISYQNFELEDRVYFIYNDNPANLSKGITDPSKIKSAVGIKKQSPVIVYIGDNGKLVKKKILSSSQETGPLIISRMDKINDTNLFLPFATPKYGKKTIFQFGNLYFK